MDRGGSVWLGTTYGGLHRLSRRVVDYWAAPAATGTRQVDTMAQDGAGTLWAGTHDDGVQVLNQGRFNKETNGTAAKYKTVYAMAATSDGVAWATGEQFLLRLAPGKEPKAISSPALKNEAIRALLPEGDAVWLGTYYGGLLKADANGVATVAPAGSFGTDITSLEREAKDVLWVGTSGGLYQWDHGNIRLWSTSESLLSSSIRCLHRDADGTLWIGTLGGGLGRLKQGRLLNITTREGLMDDVVSQIIPDDYGNIWLGCNRGLMRVTRREIDLLADGKTDSVHPIAIGKNEGVQNPQCTGGHSPTAIKTRDGRLFFPTMGGVAEVDPTRLKEIVSRPEIPQVGKVLVDGEVQPGQAIISLPPGKHRLEIQYASASLRGGEWLRFRYKLEGLDKDWVQAGPRRSAAYEALRPGRYHFHVAVHGSGENWTEAPSSLALVVRPFYWQTLWFRTGMVLGLASVIGGVISSVVIARRRREQRKFTREREQSAALLAVSVHNAIATGDLHLAFGECCERITRAINASGASIWLLDDNGADFHCAHGFNSATGHQSTAKLPRASVPAHIEALRREGVMAVENARSDPRTGEWAKDYFAPRGVFSVIDAPIHASNKLEGFIRCEHADTARRWERDEPAFVNLMANQVARAMLNAEREQALRQMRETEKRMTVAADAAQLGMWVWEAPETFMWTSPKWNEIHGYALNEHIRFDALVERVHPEDRISVERVVTDAFRAETDFHVQHRLLLPDATIRWIAMSGRVDQVAKDGPFRLTGISMDITERKEAEDAAREVSGKLITAQEDERRRIARDLHDDLNQRLALLSVETDLLGQMRNDPPAQALISEIASRVHELSSEVHKLSYQLHPAKLDQLGLVSATRSFCSELSKQAALPVEFVHENIPRELADTVALTVYRIVQEALQNVMKHSGATQARVHLRRRGFELTLDIWDNGCGFDMASLGHKAGLGLVGMRERARLVNGRVAFNSSPGHGTRITVEIPFSLKEATLPAIDGMELF